MNAVEIRHWLFSKLDKMPPDKMPRGTTNLEDWLWERARRKKINAHVDATLPYYIRMLAEEFAIDS